MHDFFSRESIFCKRRQTLKTFSHIYVVMRRYNNRFNVVDFRPRKEIAQKHHVNCLVSKNWGKNVGKVNNAKIICTLDCFLHNSGLFKDWCMKSFRVIFLAFF